MAHAGKWSEGRKALELAMCLTDDALNILLLLNPENRHDYKTLVGALRQRFGQFEQPKGGSVFSIGGVAGGANDRHSGCGVRPRRGFY